MDSGRSRPSLRMPPETREQRRERMPELSRVWDEWTAEWPDLPSFHGVELSNGLRVDFERRERG